MQHNGSATEIKSVFFDIDGTLDDSNDGHARSWCDTFAEAGIPMTYERIRPLIGAGSDKLLRALNVGLDPESERAKALVARRKEIFLERYLSWVKAFPGARELVEAFKAAGLRCIVASSASPQELDPLLAIAGVSELFDHAVKPDDIERTKPDPDVVLAALEVSGTTPDQALFVGDTQYDVQAAKSAGIRCIALRCGGSSDDTLSAADAIFDSPAALLAALESTTIDALVPRRAAKRPQG